MAVLLDAAVLLDIDVLVATVGHILVAVGALVAISAGGPGGCQHALRQVSRDLAAETEVTYKKSDYLGDRASDALESVYMALAQGLGPVRKLDRLDNGDDISIAICRNVSSETYPTRLAAYRRRKRRASWCLSWPSWQQGVQPRHVQAWLACSRCFCYWAGGMLMRDSLFRGSRVCCGLDGL